MTNAKHVLVVDDDPMVLDVTTQALNRSGFRISKATNGEEAILKLKDTLFDAIVLDRNMPNISGIDLLKALKRNERTQDIPVLMLTGDNDEDNIKECIDLGIAGYLVKPVKGSDLIARVQKVIR